MYKAATYYSIMAFLNLLLQVCMISSALFHTFSCHSEQTHRSWQDTDHFGIVWAMFGTYISFISQKFDCYSVSTTRHGL